MVIKYNKDWCAQVIELGREGLVLSAYATKLGLTVPQMQSIAKTNAEFQAAIELAMSFALSYHEQILAQSSQAKGSQPQLTLAFLKSNWPSRYDPQPESKSAAKKELDKNIASDSDILNTLADLLESLLKSAKTLEHARTLPAEIRKIKGASPPK